MQYKVSHLLELIADHIDKFIVEDTRCKSYSEYKGSHRPLQKKFQKIAGALAASGSVLDDESSNFSVSIDGIDRNYNELFHILLGLYDEVRNVLVFVGQRKMKRYVPKLPRPNTNVKEH